MLGLMDGRRVKGENYVCGTRNIWLSYEAWEIMEDILRSAEKGSKHGFNDEEEEGTGMIITIIPTRRTEG